MAQSALTVTPPNPTPPTNLSSIGMTPPDPLTYLAAVYGTDLHYPSTPPAFDDGVANTYPVISQNEGGGVNGTTVPSVVGNTKVFAAAHALVADSTGATSAAAEGAGTELAVTASVPNPSPAGQLVMVSTGLTLTAGALPNPNASHASTLSPATNPTLTSIASIASGGGTGTCSATGTNFTKQSVLVVNGVSYPTTWVSPTNITATTAKRPTAGTWPVYVITGGVVVTSTVNWTFT